MTYNAVVNSNTNMNMKVSCRKKKTRKETFLHLYHSDLVCDWEVANNWLRIHGI
jgi:hypothetical protein